MANGYLTPWRRGSLAGSGGFGTTGSLFDLHRQVNRLFDDLFDQDADTGRGSMAAPAMDVHQSEDKLEITAELPGVREEDIDLTIEDGVLTLRGEKKYERTDEERGYSERRYGTFERRITLPKSEKARGRRIPLGGGQQGAGQRTIEAQNDRENDRENRPMQQAASEEKRRKGEETQQG